MCHAAQEAGTSHHGYIDRKKENVIFTPLYLGDPLSDWNQSCYRIAYLPARRVSIPNLKEIALAISEVRAAKVSIFFFFFLCVFAHLQKVLQNANAYSDCLEIWHTERESNGES